MGNEKNKYISLKIDVKTHNQLKDISRKERRSLTNQIICILEQFVENKGFVEKKENIENDFKNANELVEY